MDGGASAEAPNDLAVDEVPSRTETALRGAAPTQSRPATRYAERRSRSPQTTTEGQRRHVPGAGYERDEQMAR